MSPKLVLCALLALGMAGLESHARPSTPAGPAEQLVSVNLDRLRELQVLAQARGSVRVCIWLETQANNPTALEGARNEFLKLASLNSADQGYASDQSPVLFLRLSSTQVDVLRSNTSWPMGGSDELEYRIQEESRWSEAAAPALAAPVLFDTALQDLGVKDAHAAGLDGSGEHIVVIDTGVDHGLLDLASKVVASYHVSETAVLGTSTKTPPGLPRATSLDQFDHGTRVAWIASKVAPAANLISIRVDDMSGTGAVWGQDILAALEQVVASWSKAPYNARVVNLSLSKDWLWGPHTSPCDATKEPELRALGLAVHNLVLKKVVVVIAAGNDGFPGRGSTGPQMGMGAPACLSESVAVTGTEPSNAYDPASGVFNQRSYPCNWSADADLAAPGAFLKGEIAIAGGTTVPVRLGPGTSTAAPFVAGAFALLRVVEPEPSLVLAALKSTGTAITLGGATVRQIRVEAARLDLASP